MNRLAIIGPGVLGLSLGGWAAERGLEVSLAGRDQDHAKLEIFELERRRVGAVARGRITRADHAQARERLRGCSAWEKATEGAHWVVEALPESLDVKASAWSRIQSFLPPGMVRFTVTSSLSLATIRSAARMALAQGPEAIRLLTAYRERGGFGRPPDSRIGASNAAPEALGSRRPGSQTGYCSTNLQVQGRHPF